MGVTIQSVLCNTRNGVKTNLDGFLDLIEFPFQSDNPVSQDLVLLSRFLIPFMGGFAGHPDTASEPKVLIPECIELCDESSGDIWRRNDHLRLCEMEEHVFGFFHNPTPKPAHHSPYIIGPLGSAELSLTPFMPSGKRRPQ